MTDKKSMFEATEHILKHRKELQAAQERANQKAIDITHEEVK
jgi:hypothetical protein